MNFMNKKHKRRGAKNKRGRDETLTRVEEHNVITTEEWATHEPLMACYIRTRAVSCRHCCAVSMLKGMFSSCFTS